MASLFIKSSKIQIVHSNRIDVENLKIFKIKIRYIVLIMSYVIINFNQTIFYSTVIIIAMEQKNQFFCQYYHKENYTMDNLSVRFEI